MIWYDNEICTYNLFIAVPFLVQDYLHNATGDDSF